MDDTPGAGNSSGSVDRCVATERVERALWRCKLPSAGASPRWTIGAGQFAITRIATCTDDRAAMPSQPLNPLPEGPSAPSRARRRGHGRCGADCPAERGGRCSATAPPGCGRTWHRWRTVLFPADVVRESRHPGRETGRRAAGQRLSRVSDPRRFRPPTLDRIVGRSGPLAWSPVD